MVKLTDNYLQQADKYTSAGIKLPQHDQEVINKNTQRSPVGVHFGDGNLFWCFHAEVAQKLLDQWKTQFGNSWNLWWSNN